LEWWSGKRTTNKRSNRRIYAIKSIDSYEIAEKILQQEMYMLWQKYKKQR